MVSRNNNRLFKIVCTPVPERMPQSTIVFEVYDITGKNQNITRYGQRMMFDPPADALETILGRKVDIVSESARKRPGFYEEISKDLIAL